jgi:hypothetical protein
MHMMALAHKNGSLSQEFYESLTGKAIPRKTLHAEIEGWLAQSASTTKPGALKRYRAIMDQ